MSDSGCEFLILDILGNERRKTLQNKIIVQLSRNGHLYKTDTCHNGHLDLVFAFLFFLLVDSQEEEHLSNMDL